MEAHRLSPGRGSGHVRSNPPRRAEHLAKLLHLRFRWQLASLMLLRIPLTVAVNHLAFEKVAERR